MEQKLFYKDVIEGVCKSYQDLLEDLQGQYMYNKYCRSKSYYEIFKQLIFSILIDEEIVLLDADFSDAELKGVLGDITELEYGVEIPKERVLISMEVLQSALQRKNSKWKVTLFTSGTTGLPKKVSHTLTSISRFVKFSEKHKTDTWGFAYNPTHMAGLQVFFQALQNFNPIVRLFGLSRDEILKLIDLNQITNISATPTFYRLLLPADRELHSVRRITSGGEKFDALSLQSLQKMFVNAKITNVYASTEAGTLFAACGDVFTLKEEMRDRVRVIDDELLLHKSLMGYSDGLKFQGDWYETGDLITVITENPFTFKFISRRNEMINVGGYKVNPTEVEEMLRNCPGIEDAFVFGKQNRLLGNLVCCEVVCLNKELTEKAIRTFLSGKLQEFKIPRIIKFVEQLNVTRTGKIARNKK